MPRAVIIVIDGFGVGELPDAGDYGDRGANTLGNLSRAAGGLNLPALESMGLGHIGDFEGINKTTAPLASFGRMAEVSKGKDTITGHWEMTGVLTPVPFPTYPHGFPKEVIDEFERRTGRKALGNKAASGTEIIKELGDEHVRTGSPIVYTSADSVFQIAAHEGVVPREELYRICETAREILVPPHNVQRVIARPFVGPPYQRTPWRRDFALEPPERTVLDMLVDMDVPVVSIGKVKDMFAGRGFTRGVKTSGNADSMLKLRAEFDAIDSGLVFCNLVDFDTLYGHRNDVEGYAQALLEFDLWLGGFIDALGESDYLFITADHGCDPTAPGTDHTREYVPVLFFNKNTPARDLGTRKSFMDLGATAASIFGVKGFRKGESFFIR